MIQPKALILALGLAAFLSACAGKTTNMSSGLINRLKNRGPVALSSENPYLAGNLLVSREMERSPELRGFIEHRGAPAAIEVNHNMFSPLMMDFFYPENREFFELEDLEGVWVIRGPLHIEREKMREVASITRKMQGTPKLSYNKDSLSPPAQPKTNSMGAGTSPIKGTVALEEEDPFIRRLREVEEQQAKSSGSFQSPSSKVQPSAGLTDSSRMQSLSDRIGPHPAELTPKGDLVHYVTYSGETLSMIARWYTHDRANAGRIARINELKNPNQLEIGDTIIIPRYLLKNRNRLTEESVHALSTIAGRKRGGY